MSNHIPVSCRVLPALQVAGYLLATTTFTHKLAGTGLTGLVCAACKICSTLLQHAVCCTTDDEQEHILQSLVALLHSITRKVSRRPKQYTKHM